MDHNLFKPYHPKCAVEQKQRHLPHWNQEDCTYFITFRCADSLPQSKLNELQQLRSEWLTNHAEPWNNVDRIEYQKLFSENIDKWLDRGYGECQLAHIEIREIVYSALSHFDQQRYTLDHFVVMPNHVQALVKPWGDIDLPNILHSWKSFTVREINTRLKRSGEFWMSENYDHVVRSWEQLEHYREYIKQNPSKAKLSDGKYSLGKGHCIVEK